jgi:hypothetical protein
MPWIVGNSVFNVEDTSVWTRRSHAADVGCRLQQSNHKGLHQQVIRL